MKIIVIKEYKNYKPNDIIDVSDGFAKNFLIKNNYAVSYNKENEKSLNSKLKVIKENEKIENIRLEKMKVKLEKIKLEFTLKVFNGNVIGSISTKMISKQISNLEIHIPKHSLQHVNIKSLGISDVMIKLNKNITATIQVDVKGAHV